MTAPPADHRRPSAAIHPDHAAVPAEHAGAGVPRQPGAGPARRPRPTGRPAGDRAARRRHAWLAGVVLIAAGGAGYAYGFAGDVPRGTVVLGADLGGLTRAEAAARLRAALAAQADRLAAPVPLRVGERVVPVRPAAVGLAVDVDATVAAVADQWPGPSAFLPGDREVRPVVTVDADRLHAALADAAALVSRPLTPPAIRFTGGTPDPVYPEPGWGLDPARTAATVRASWPARQPARQIDVPVVELLPATSTAQVDGLLRDLAEPAVAAPVAVAVGGATLTVSPVSIAQSLVLVGDAAGRITPRVDPARLRAALANQLAAVERRPVQARVRIAGGTPRILGGAPGRRVDTEALARDLLAVLPDPAPRSVMARVVADPPATGEADLRALGIRERVSTFTTRFPGGLRYGRSRNIVRAARQVDGAVVRPGETFSLNGHTGPRGYAQGYVDAPVILDGKLVPGVGGGVSQFTTTLFNAAYYAGLEDVEHRPHSYWFARYPPVIESTIFYPNMDLKFRNDTPYGVLIDTSYTSRTVTVSMWSTRVYDSVRTSWGPRRSVTTPRTVRLKSGPSCIATKGIDGFTQDAWRIFRKAGKEVRRERFTWRYDAEPKYVCAG